MPGRFESRIPAISNALPREFDIATLEAAHAIEEIAKERVEIKDGELRDAIHVERAREGDRLLTWVVAWSRKAWYGHLVEWGHHQKGGRGNHEVVGTVPPHPFMVPAAEVGREIARERADHAVKEAAKAQ